MSDQAANLALAHAARSAGMAKSALELLQEASLDVSATQEAMILARLSEMPKSYRLTYLRATRGKSYAAGVKSFCLECLGWERAGIPQCTSLGCPLYPYRPYSGNTT